MTGLCIHTRQIRKQARRFCEHAWNICEDMGYVFATIVHHKTKSRLSVVRHTPNTLGSVSCGAKAHDFEKSKIENMLQMNLIEPSYWELLSLVDFAPKKDGTLRFCVDYRKINAIKIRNLYPLPRMDTCIDMIVDARVCSALDANSGY